MKSKMKWIFHKCIVKMCYFSINHLFIMMDERSCEWKRKCLRKAGNIVGEGTKIVGPIECTGTLKIGNNCWIGKNLKVNGNGTVEIGDCCDIGPEVTFQTGGHQIGNADRRAGEGRIFSQKVGAGTWIGGRVTICNEVSIGKGSVIAGCACVVKDVPANTLAGGVPACTIRRLDV